MSAMSALNISLKGVRKTFNGVVALDGVQIDFEKPGISAIIGPNGAGKTTLLDVTTARLRSDAGRIEICGRSLRRGSTPDLVSSLGVARTFQELRLFRQMSVTENLLVAQRHHSSERLWRALLGVGVAREEAKHHEEAIEALRFVGLEDHAQALAGELSYGQQKLVALAQCLATSSRLFLLDEPVAGPPDGGVPALCDAEGWSPGADGPAEPGAEERLAVRLLDRGARHVVLTRGERGVLLADARGVRPVPAAPARPRDVTGAGDALVAGVLAGLLAGHDLDGAAAVGTLVAARTVESEHSVRPDLPAALIDPTAERYDRQEGAP